MRFIDTHIHIDGEEFDEDRDLVIERARMAQIMISFLITYTFLSGQR